MRLRASSIATLTLATAGSVVVASPTLHLHRHVHSDKRTVKIVDVAGPTVVAYELNGQPIDQSEVCAGIEAGTLKWADGSDDHPPQCLISTEQYSQQQLTSTEPTTSATSEISDIRYSTTENQPTISSTTKESSATPSTSSTLSRNTLAAERSSVQSTTSSLPATLNNVLKEDVRVGTPQASTTTPSTSAVSAGSSAQFRSAPGGQGLDTEFPDGEIDCTVFPSDYGPIQVKWANLGGWSGIQYVTIKGNIVTEIITAVPEGDGCKPGAMCSYACPPGYQKSQWPSTQGSTGQSVGGLSCNSNGKLTLTNPGLSRNLCIQGTGAVTVQNKLSNNAAICRTDYPGWSIATLDYHPKLTKRCRD